MKLRPVTDAAAGSAAAEAGTAYPPPGCDPLDFVGAGVGLGAGVGGAGGGDNVCFGVGEGAGPGAGAGADDEREAGLGAGCPAGLDDLTALGLARALTLVLADGLLAGAALGDGVTGCAAAAGRLPAELVAVRENRVASPTTVMALSCVARQVSLDSLRRP